MIKMKLWMLAAILFCGAGCLVSCNGIANKEAADGDTAVAEAVATAELAVDKYLVDSIGVHYSQGEVCIPCATIVAKIQNSPDSVQAWGDFWVFNFNVAGDTLKCVSGGDHPGLMTIKKAENGDFVVTLFEQVEDGHGNEASARRIFGNMYEAFHDINSSETRRESLRAKCIADYVKAHNLPVKYYQDYGWPAKEIPTE